MEHADRPVEVDVAEPRRKQQAVRRRRSAVVSCRTIAAIVAAALRGVPDTHPRVGHHGPQRVVACIVPLLLGELEDGLC